MNPGYEVYVGYQYVRAKQFNQNFGLGQTIGGFDMHGGDSQFVYNYKSWAGFVVDAGGVTKPNIGIPGVALGVADTTAFVYGGPRFYHRRNHHGIFGLAPFAEILFGGAFLSLLTPDSRAVHPALVFSAHGCPTPAGPGRESAPARIS